MQKAPILLLQPKGDHPAAADQAAGARLAASLGPARDRIALEQGSFRQGDLEELEEILRRWVGKILGVVGATNVPESARLGELAEELGLLCFVSNNNPAVRAEHQSLFHIGVPTAVTSRAVADHLLNRLGGKRFYLLYDNTEFQKRVASDTEMNLRNGGAAVLSGPGAQSDWLDHVQTWKPDLLYLIYSNEDPALSLARSLRRTLPETLLLMGRSLLRQSFLASLGEDGENFLMVDIFHRGALRTKEETLFMGVLAESGIDLPTANHGFGWDAMTLCGRALAEGGSHLSSAIQYLESGIRLEAATGYCRFSREDHNGRSEFNPTTLSRLRHGQVEPYDGSGR